MFWDRFYSLCIKRNTKPNPVAKELKISSGLVTKWKNGSLPNTDALLRLSDYFNVSIDYLLCRTNNLVEEKSNNRISVIFDKIAEIGLPFSVVFSETGVSVSKLTAWSNGESCPTDREAKILCDYVGYSFEDVFGKKYDPDLDDYIFLYNNLDMNDKAIIRTEIKHMLRAGKYNQDTTPTVPYGELAALGGIENPQPPRKKRETT